MKKIENLAKILFLFFAVVSLGLVTVSCTDDDDDDVTTTTNTTQEEDDEDLDSIPIEEMTLEQLKKVFIGSWEGAYVHVYGYSVFEDTLTFYKSGAVKETSELGYYDGSTFELLENSYINFSTDKTNRKMYKYQLTRNEDNIYEITIPAWNYFHNDDVEYNIIYRKIK